MKFREVRDYVEMKVLIMLFIVIVFTLGYLCNDMYHMLSYQRKFDGLYIQGTNYTMAKELSYSRDGHGDWVCINVKNMDYKTALKTCEHETAHEIFAEHCEDDVERCMEAIKDE